MSTNGMSELWFVYSTEYCNTKWMNQSDSNSEESQTQQIKDVKTKPFIIVIEIT